jgi:hypothetical protein
MLKSVVQEDWRPTITKAWQETAFFCPHVIEICFILKTLISLNGVSPETLMHSI